MKKAFVFSMALAAMAEAQPVQDMVYVAGDKPFLIDVFEMDCNEAVALIPGSCNLGNMWKPVRTTFDLARQLCEKQGKRLPTKEEWLRAASGNGRNSIYSLRRDSTQFPETLYRSDGKTLAVNAGGTSGSINPKDIGNLGIDVLGTVGMTGNRAEWTASEKGDAGQCGGQYETTNLDDLKLDRTCLAPLAGSATPRCVNDLKPEIRVSYTGFVTPELRKIIDEETRAFLSNRKGPSIDDLLIEESRPAAQ